MNRTKGMSYLLVSAGIMAALAASGTVSVAFGQVSGTWQLTHGLNTPRTGHSATLLNNGEVLVVGGRDSSGNILTTAELYNPSTGLWSTTGATATARVEHSATLLPNGEVLVAGGLLGVIAGQSTYASSAELYNPATGNWTPTGSMTVPRALAGAALLASGEVLVAGGSNADGTSSRTSELYNPSTGKWTSTGNMPVSENAPATLLSDGRVLIAGVDNGELYNPTTGQWTETPGLYYPDSTGITAAFLLNGNVLIYGNHLPSYASQFYNPAANAWSPTRGQNSNGINSGPLVTLANGNVLLAGGIVIYSGRSSLTARSDLYNPSTNLWSVTGSLKQAVSHTATRLQNGQVLAVGGADAELYTP